MNHPIGELPYRDAFVRTLPGDPDLSNRTRQVFNAAYSRVTPTAVDAPDLLALVPEVCDLIGLAPVATPELVEVLAGNRIVPGMAPYAACYGGHQFGSWAGQLGDGRAITLGEVAGDGGAPWELQLKGAGPTPYSRRADGRAVLRSSLREFVCSEAMHHLGVPTTRALSLVLTGEPVLRDMLYDGNARNEPGAVVCRVAPSFLRFGNYELPASRDDLAMLKALVHFTVTRFYPQHVHDDDIDLVGWFAEVAHRTAFLVSEWMRVGFVHGVMNTDNMSILGLTIDYGPYGWLEPFDLDWTPNITDASGRRYRFGNQPAVAHWNLAKLARALAQLASPEALPKLQRAVDAFAPTLASLHRHSMLRKLGLVGGPDTAAEDDALLLDLEPLLLAAETDMTLFFRGLADLPVATPPTDATAFGVLRDAYYAPESVDAALRAQLGDWCRAYARRVRREPLADGERATRMNAINPLYVPRNYLLQEVIDATEAGDRTALPALMAVLRAPYTARPEHARYAAKRPEWARHKAGCSMLSCSS